MEINHNPMPKFDIHPTHYVVEVVKEVGKKALDFLFDRNPTPLYLSNHYRGEPSTRGAEAMLASMTPEVPASPVQGTLEFTEMDDMGNYIYIDRSRV